MLEQIVKDECIAHTSTGSCLMRKSQVCNLTVGKRCSHFARVMLPRHPEALPAYGRLPQRGPDDTPEAVAGCARATRTVTATASTESGARRARTCKCGSRLPHRRPLCDGCRDERRRERIRLRVAKHRRSKATVDASM